VTVRGGNLLSGVVVPCGCYQSDPRVRRKARIGFRRPDGAGGQKEQLIEVGGGGAALDATSPVWRAMTRKRAPESGYGVAA
jgi:hypothetical protein